MDDPAQVQPTGHCTGPTCPSPAVALDQAAPDLSLRVVLDTMDKVAVSSTLPEVLECTEGHLVGTATDLTNEGGRGAAARRLLARDIATGRVILRYHQSLLNNMVNKMCKGQASDKLVKVLGRIVDAEHRRMITSLELLARLDSPAPAISVRANQAAVLIGTGEPR